MRQKPRKPKPETIRNWAPIPAEWVNDPRYTNAALAIWPILWLEIVKRKHPDGRTAPLPDIEELRTEAGVSWHTAKDGLAALEAAGAIAINREARTFELWKHREEIIGRGFWRQIWIDPAWLFLSTAARAFMARLLYYREEVNEYQAALAARCGLSVRQVQRHIDNLVRAGIIDRGWRGGKRLYRFLGLDGRQSKGKPAYTPAVHGVLRNALKPKRPPRRAPPPPDRDTDAAWKSMHETLAGIIDGSIKPGT